MLGSSPHNALLALTNLMNASKTFSLPSNVFSDSDFSNAGHIAEAFGPVISVPDDEATSATVNAAECFIVHFGDSRYSTERALISFEYRITAREPPTFSLQVFSNCSLTGSSRSCLAKKTNGKKSAARALKRSVANFDTAYTISPEICRFDSSSALK